MHGGKHQTIREETLQKFKDQYLDVLVCTNVMARGIDIEGVKHVINFDCPNTLNDYIHRIGRTGRAGRKGKATTFLKEDDKEIFPELIQFLEDNGQKYPQRLTDLAPKREEKIVEITQ